MTPISADRLSRLNIVLTATASGRRHKGFTLLELLVVLSVIVLATSIIIPNITSTDNNLLSAQVRQTASAFNYARRIAIVNGSPQTATLILLEPDDPEYPEIKGEVLQRASRATMPLLENFSVEVSYQADINEQAEVLDIIEIVFFPQGGSTGGILNFTMEDLTARIRIDPITGKINIRYPGEEFDDEYY